MIWGPHAKIRMGPLYICLEVPFFVVMLAAAQWCPIARVQCFYIFHVHAIIHLADTFILSVEETE